MKPVFANYFRVTVTPSGECVLNIYHNYPTMTVDEQINKGFETEEVASIVMTHADAKVLADVMNTTLNNLKQAEQLANKQGGTVN